jgi:hypothetical protein
MQQQGQQNQPTPNTTFPHQQFMTMQPQPAIQRGGVARALAFAKGLSGKTVALTVIVIAAQGFLPEGRRPSDIIGSFHGNTEKAEMAAKQDKAVEYEQQMAAARAVPPANAQIETQTAQTQLQAVAGSLETQQTLAGLSDLACIGGLLLSQADDPDARDAGKKLAGGCAIGDAIRQNMTETVARTARGGSAVIQRASPGMTPPVPPVQVRPVSH